MKRLWIAMLAAVITCGCERQPTRGIITKKNYRPAWTQVLFVTCHGPGGSVTMMPYTVVHPEQWDVVVRADGTNDETGDFLVVVDRPAWDAMGVGDVWERQDTIHQETKR